MPGPPFDRAELRDRIRNLLDIPTPLELGYGVAGQQPSSRPNPSNAQLNNALRLAIADINTYAGFHVTEFTVAIAAQSPTFIGPFAFGLNNITGPTQLTNDIRSARFLDSATGQIWRLYPQYREVFDREDIDLYNGGVGVPRYFWISGYSFYMWPAPQDAGTLTLIAGTGVSQFLYDGDVIDQLPIDLQVGVEYQALVNLGMTMAGDIETQQRAMAYKPKADAMLERIRNWASGGDSTEQQPSIGFRSHRSRSNYSWPYGR